MPDRRHESVGADTMPGKRAWLGKIEAPLLEKSLFEHEAPLVEKLREIFSEGEIVVTEIVEPRCARLVVHFDRPIEIGADDTPAIGIEAAVAELSCQATVH